MAPTPTLDWVIPAQTVRLVASIVGNSTHPHHEADRHELGSFTKIMAAMFFAGTIFGYFVAFMNFLERRSMRKESSEKEVSEKDLLIPHQLLTSQIFSYATS